MQKDNSPGNPKISLNFLRLYLSLAILLSTSTLIFEIQRTLEIRKTFYLSLSPTQLIVFATMALGIVGAGWLLVQTWVNIDRTRQRLERLSIWLGHPQTWARTLLITGAVFLVGCFFITLTPEITEPTTLGVFERLLPVVVWITGLCGLTLIALIYFRYAPNLIEWLSKGKVFFIALAFLGIIFLGWAWITRNTFELLAERSGWNSLGVPVIDTQLFLAWFAGMAMLALIALTAKAARRSLWIEKLLPRRFDFLVGFCLWIFTVVLWQSTPIVPSWFVTELRSPNYEHYPNSDALKYDRVSQAHLIGEGFRDFRLGSAFSRRALLAGFHSILHLIGGQDYEKVVAIQALVLALLPTLVYALTTMIYNRVSGVIAAILIMLRETNSIAIADTITASHAKLLLSDLPTQFLMVCLAISAVAWMKRIHRISVYPLICGGLLGLTILIRTEAALLYLPLVAVSGMLLLPQKRSQAWLKQALLLTLGALLIVTPWLWRTWKLTGYFTIDSPKMYMRLFEKRSVSIEDSPQTYPSPQEFDEPAGELSSGRLVNFVGIAASHYLNSQLQTILTPPTTVRAIDSFTAYLYHRRVNKFVDECCSLENYVRRLPYWHQWDGRFPSQSLIPLMLIVITIASGVSTSWKRHAWVGLIPLILSTAYLVIHAFLRSSGGRFILPADWAVLIYFSIGLAHISTRAIQSTTQMRFAENFGLPPAEPELLDQPGNLLQSPGFYAAVVGIFLIGCVLPLFEFSIPQRYTEARKTEMLSRLMHSENLEAATRQDLQRFASQGGTIFTGRGLYPRFFPKNKGEPGSKNVFGIRAYPRIGFYLAGPQSGALVMPFQSDKLVFPNASDVIVFACVDPVEDETPGWDVLAVAVFNPSGAPESLLFRSPMPSQMACPLSADPSVP